MSNFLTYGLLPTKEEFEELCNIPDEYGKTIAEYGCSFGNDEFVGTCVLSEKKLYSVMTKIHNDWLKNADEASGHWLNNLLYVLGWGLECV